MAKKKAVTSGSVVKLDVPVDLSNHMFFGLTLDEKQRALRDAIWSDKYDIVFCNAKAGSGKTLITIATAMLMCEYEKFDSIVYMSAAGVHESKQGLLPGTLEEKSKFCYIPLQQALLCLGYDPNRVICSDMNILAQKEGKAMIVAQTDSYIRGMNIGDSDNRVIYIIDESQNFDKRGLQTVLTRVNNGSKTICIGHDAQCDLKYSQDSGFVPFLNHFRGQERCAICELTTNYRGWVSAWADEIK